MGGVGGGAMGHQTSQALTEDQVTQVRSILSEYDASSQKENDLAAINQSFKDAGIRPSHSLRETIESAGFDPEALHRQGGPDAKERPPLSQFQQGNKINIQALQSLQEILGEYDFSNLSSDDEEELTSRLLGSGLFRAGPILDVTV